MDDAQTDLIFVSFGSDWRYRRIARRMLERGSLSYPNAWRRVYGAPELPVWMRKYAQQHRRGFGYWIWKAWLLDRTLADSKEDAVVVYVDARSRFPRSRIPWLDSFVAVPSWDVAAWQMSHPEKTWTTTDLFLAMDRGPDSDDAQSGQYAATFFAVRNTDASRSLVSDWLEFQTTQGGLVRADETVAPNSYPFRENRFDQSVLSLLLKARSAHGLRVMVLADDVIQAEDSIGPHAAPHPDAFYPLTHTRIGQHIKRHVKNLLATGT